IATETAGALSYLHSAASVPIIHRDIKPTNILLDDNYIAKVSDFGASKLIPTDQIELATIVQGTLGYLDPEYLQTNQLTDKSDVYSFGVVLVELLSGKKALSFDRPEKERNLAMYFLSSLKEGTLFHVLDEHLLLNEGIPNEIINVSRLAERCLRVNGDERPTMKEVAMELEGILASMIQRHPWVQTTSKEEESEYLLKQAMDGSEYTNATNTSSMTFDSITKQTILPMSSGR
ncbi:wall-associated receptor kinase 4, partial [Cynara cardunculus var. scolymus]|uniref:wall-associated receptor kinase 4 n=1 Tax=Cynara cardunculus var. scolymus TaxID=59895 RepID=UPI000D62DA10